MAEFVITAPDGKKYKVTGATKEGALAALKQKLGATPQPSRGHDAMNSQAIAAIEQAKAAGDSPREAAFLQGALFNMGDEMYGGVKALQSGFKEGEYTRARDQARGLTDAAVAEHPWFAAGGGIATGVPAAIATGGSSLGAAIGTGAAQGGVAAYGATKGNDLQAVKDVAFGSALGGAGGAAGYGLGKLIERFTTRGLSVETIRKALDGNTDELLNKVQQLGGSAAEADEVLREVLRGQAAKNPTAAAAAVPGAQARLAQVNTQVIDDINNVISPENVSAFTQRTQDATRNVTQPGYAAVAANPAQLSLTPELANMPGVDEALQAAQQLAAFQKRPFDPQYLTAQDLDVMQRFLRLSKEKSFMGSALDTMKGPAYGDARTVINDLAKQVSPELAQSQAAVATQKAVEEATDLGLKALNPSKEAVEVAAEFTSLAPEAQAGYRAAFASRLRAALASKGSTANVANVLDKPAIIEKLKILGFPAEQIDEIIGRGAAARGTVDALQGGSDTARKLAAAAASESPLTKVKSGDLAAAALVHPSALFALPMLRSLGAGQERRVAETVIKALTSQSPEFLQNLFRYAPQRATPFLGMFGGVGASQIGQPR